MEEVKLNSRVILEVTDKMSDTFDDLQKLKGMGVANHKSLIMDKDGGLLPAGLYSDYEKFMDAYCAISDIKDDDPYLLTYARNVTVNSMESMTPIEKAYSIIYWEKYYATFKNNSSVLFDWDILEKLTENESKKLQLK
jgi:hypothetical protein